MKTIIYLLTVIIIASCSDLNSAAPETAVEIDTKIDTTERPIIALENDLKQEAEKDSIAQISMANDAIYRQSALNLSFNKVTLFDQSDTIHADFNGDGITDKAVYFRKKETSGIIIINGEINEEVNIGFGKQFAHMTEFDWVDYWALVLDKETSENVSIENGELLESRNIQLQNPSIALGKDEVGGGLITFLNGKYVWIHQTC